MKVFHFIILLIMLSTISATAQKKISFEWNASTQLPEINNSPSFGYAGPVTGVHNDIFFVGGGANFPEAMPWQGGKKKYYNSLYTYKISASGKPEFFKSFEMPDTLAYSACASTPTGIVCAGGENQNGISNKTFLLKWDAIGQQPLFEALPQLPLPLTNAAITVRKNKVYLAGGESANAASAMFMMLDLKDIKAGWKLLPPVPVPVSHIVMAMQCNGKNNCVYIIGGRKKTSSGISELYSSVFEYNIKKNEWTEKASLPYTLCAGTGVAFGKKRIIVFGGDDGSTFHKVETMIAAINTEKDEAKKQALVIEKNNLQSSHPGFNKNILVFNTKKNEWTTVSQMPSAAPVTTTAVLYNGTALIPSGEIKAGVRSPEILSVKIIK